MAWRGADGRRLVFLNVRDREDVYVSKLEATGAIRKSVRVARTPVFAVRGSSVEKTTNLQDYGLSSAQEV
jgi:hypothetical protein